MIRMKDQESSKSPTTEELKQIIMDTLRTRAGKLSCQEVSFVLHQVDQEIWQMALGSCSAATLLINYKNGDDGKLERIE